MKQYNPYSVHGILNAKFCLFLIFTTLTSVLIAQTPGDILFTGYNSDGPDEFSFICTKALAGNLQIHFTDNGWTSANGGEFRQNEGEIMYTTPTHGTKQGEQIAIQVGSGSAPSVIYGGGSVIQIGSNSITLSSAGDGLIAFSGSLNNPTPLAVISTDASGWTNPASNTQTNLPTALVVGESAFLLLENGITESDNWIYNCDTVYGSLADLQLGIGQLANWSSDNSTIFSIPCSPFVSTWNGSWSPEEPSAQNNIVINSSSLIPGELNCREISINFGQTLNLGNSGLNLAGNLINNGNGIQSTGIIRFLMGDSTLTLSGNPISTETIIEVGDGCVLNANSNLILGASSQDTFGQINGDGEVLNLVVQRYIDPTIPKYFHLGMPLKNAMLDEFNEGNILQSSNSSQGSIWEWDAQIAQWKEPGDVSTTAAIQGKAYALYAGTNSFGTFLIGNPGTLNYSGSPNMDTVQIALEYNDGQSSGSPNFVGGSLINHTQGWNLLCNPYPSYYDWDLQTIPNNMGSAIYRFDGSNYTTYLKGAGTGSRFLKPGEAYFVQVQSNTSNYLVFNPNNRNPSKISGSGKRLLEFDGFSIRIESSSSHTWDETFIGFNGHSSPYFDPGYDAWKLLNQGDKPNLYTEMSDGFYSINRFNLNDQTSSIPLSFSHDIDGDSICMTFNFKNLNSEVRLLIEDLKSGNFHVAQKLEKLCFVYHKNFRKDRFRIHFQTNNLSQQENIGSDLHWYISQNNDGIIIHHDDLLPKMISVFSLDGSLVKTMPFQERECQIPIRTGGLYLVKLTNAQNKSSESQKVLFQKS